METRNETDSLGTVAVPVDRYWGAHTARALADYGAGRTPFPAPFIHALGLVKACAAEALVTVGAVDERRGALIRQAADEVAAGRLDDHFPLSPWQSGSGTQTHMNANEVIAGRANELAGTGRGGKDPVHPNDHVNRGQSTNDVVPTAMHVAILVETTARLLPAVDVLGDALAARAGAWRDLVTIGRTHLMDAVPVTLGQQASGWAHQVRAARDRVAAAAAGLHEVALGGTAVGTGLNAPDGFAEAAVARLAARTGLPLVRAANPFAAQGAHDAVVAFSGALRDLAVGLVKIAGDVRLLASGPRCGLGELTLPANEPGSSIMPGKINPGQAEALTMAALRVIGLDAAVAAGGGIGHLQMNDAKPLLAVCVLEQVDLLAGGCRGFAERCVAGLVPVEARLAEHVERSLMLVTALAPRLGYDAAAAVAHEALETGATLRAVVLAKGLLDEAEYDRLTDPRRLAEGTPPRG